MDGFTAAELEVLDWIAQHLHTDLLDSIMPWISRLANSGGIWLLLGVLLMTLNRKERRVGGQVLLSMLLSLFFCNLILKNAVGRLRPFVQNPLVELLIAAPGDPSFPSGHSSVSFAAAAVSTSTSTFPRMYWQVRLWESSADCCPVRFGRMGPNGILCASRKGSVPTAA